MGISEQLKNKHDTINTDRDSENATRKTSVNFRNKPLSLQAAIEKDLLKNNKSLRDNSASSKFRTRKIHTIAP